MTKLIILRGLPASGKSTWARQWAEDPANTWPHCVVSLDAIRLMIAGAAQNRDRMRSKYGRRFEDLVVSMGRHMIADALDAGWDVVADAQHANPAYASELARLAVLHGALWETRDFDVPLEELLRRNTERDEENRVPEDYMRESWKRFHAVMFRPLTPGDPNGNLLERMHADPYVRVMPVRGERDVFACNFTSEAFRKGRWNERTINARGLFVDDEGRVVQRGFEKFFAVDETEQTTFDKVVAYGDEHPGAFPIRVERKENGFLGLVGAAGERGRFRFWSKSGQTDYSALIERLFPSDPTVRERLWQLLHEWNVTAAFEVIDVESDRHIVGYERSGLRMLHLIRNQETFSIDYGHEPEFASAGGFAKPEVVAVCNTSQEVAQAIDDARRTDREGVVLYFADGWMVKVKSEQYRLVKSLRPLLQRVVLRGRPINKSGETADLARAVIDYAHDHDMDLTYRRQAFGERDVDMTKVGDILRLLGRG